jgi:class 3 adenylate cyclase/tetratricopeptide (TPR) repeat protein
LTNQAIGAGMQEISDWLTKLGMSEYADDFTKNRIDLSVLPDLTDQDLEKLGVLLGDRRKMLRAIRELAISVPPSSQPAVVSESLAHDGAERRQLTVMFCDLVGSTALSTRLDPEDLREVIGAYHRRCAEVIIKHGGFVARYMGDGILAYFGYPYAHEDDAEQAVSAGLTLVEAVTKIDVGAGTALQVRVGIATGLVVVGDLGGEGAAREHGVFGETPNVAARLQGLVEPGVVVVAGNTRCLLGELFECRALGSIPIKGLGDPVAIWEVIGRSAVDSRFEALHATRTPLVGRDEEIDLIMRRWRQVKDNDGSVVLIVGEPGIGKSRVAQTVLERLSGEPHTRLRLFCSPDHQDSSLYPMITHFERAAGFRREDTTVQRLDKLEAVLRRATDDLTEALPLLATLLSISSDGRFPPIQSSPQKQKERVLRVLVDQVAGLARREPVLILIEDTHWIDDTSRELLDLMIDRTSCLPVLMIITFRPEFAAPWAGRPHVTLLSLSRLQPTQRAEMIAHLTEGKELPAEVAEQVMYRSDGIPLFIEELTKAVVESGLLTDAGGRYTVTAPLPALAIPMTLNASLLARIDRLAMVREVVHLAAAIGRHFSHELISAVAGMPRHQLDDALEQLTSAELIFRHGSPPNVEYTFKHALVRDAAYSTLLRGVRQQLHARIAATFESQFPEIVEAQPDLLARHCSEACLMGKAVGYWLKAGQRALARSAMTEAAAQLRKGLDLVSSVPDATLRCQYELDLQIALGSALIATKGYAAKDVGEAFARARRLCEQSNDPRQSVRALQGEWVHHLIRAELGLARQCAAEMRQLGQTRDSVALRRLGCFMSGHTSLKLGELPEARSCLEQSIAIFDPEHPPSDEAMGLRIGSLTSLSCTLGFLGHLDQARNTRDEALKEARRLSHAYTLALTLTVALHLEHAINSVNTLLQFTKETMAFSAEHGFPFCWATATMYNGWCLVALGEQERGLTAFKQGLVTYRATDAILDTPLALIVFADALCSARHPEEGLRQLAQAVPTIECRQDRFAEAEMYRVRGDLLKSVGDPAAAEESYYRALAVSRSQRAKLWELRAAMSLAHLLRDKGRRTEAHDLLAPICGWFTEGFDTPVMRDALAFLDELA